MSRTSNLTPAETVLRRRVAEAFETGQTHVVTFHRKGAFYPIEVPLDPVLADLPAHAELNPGTLRIEDAKGNVLWSLQ